MRDRPSDTAHRRAVGKPLKAGDVVHHLDEDKSNNAPANLTVEPRAAHTARHNAQRGLSKLRAALRMPREGRKTY